MHKWEDLGMDFGQAMSRVANGGRVSRNSWVGDFLRRDGDMIRRMSGPSSVPYSPTQADMLADDWRFGEPANLDTTATLEVPFKGDAWPGVVVTPEMTTTGVVNADPRTPAAENRDPDAA